MLTNVLSSDIPLPLTEITPAAFKARDVRLQMLDLTAVHPQISGNKWFKLKYNLQAYLAAGKQVPVLSFGGAWSNHLHALAYAGKLYGIPTIGVIRGERPAMLSAMLQDAESWGMQLVFVSREAYRQKQQAGFIDDLRQLLGEFEYLPEGGSNALAVKGCRDIMLQLAGYGDFDYVCCACGTGATLAGLIAAKPDTTQVLGVAALKGAQFLYDDIRQLLQQGGYPDPGNWRLILDAHEGGYGKISPRLADCLARFTQQYERELEPLYTGKLMLALEQSLENNAFKAGSEVVMLHTGGLQGLRGMRQKLAARLAEYHRR